jgi:predicted DCC family thiol-disulfide oxidoreductase YuxK
LDRPLFSWRDDPAVPDFPDDLALFVFDGDCVLCSRSARFVLMRDRAGRIRFAAAQTPLGRALMAHGGLDPDDPASNIVLAEGRMFLKSDAALKLAGLLGLPWSLALVLGLVPRILRNGVYDIIARRRIRLFGARQACYLAEPGMADRFLS